MQGVGGDGRHKDEILTVSFNLMMQLREFEDASYRRVP